MSDCCAHKKHPDHAEDIPRLNRINGQVEGIKKMIEEGRYCPDIMAQIKAIRSALKSVEANMLERHLAGCVADVMEKGNKKDKTLKIEEIKNLFKKSES